MNTAEEAKIKYNKKRNTILWDFVRVGQIAIGIITLNLFGVWIATIIFILTFIPEYIFRKYISSRDNKMTDGTQKIMEPKE